MSETFYDVLGVDPDASTSEIEAAYRERIKETHPDRSDADDAEAATRRVIEARDVLTDDAEREKYDRLGHEAYVAGVSPSADASDVSDAAAAARNVSTESAGGSEGNRSGPTNARAGPYERRRRERRAWRDVDFGSSDGDGGNPSDEGAPPGGGTDPTQSQQSVDGGTATYGDSFWNQTGGSSRGYTVGQYDDDQRLRDRLRPTGQSLTLFGLAFLLYPVMLFSALFPPFPLVVNVVVGICTVLLVGYLQSVPGVGTLVFGGWSVVTTAAMLVVGVEFASLVGVIALSGTWLPFGLSALTLWLIRP